MSDTLTPQTELVLESFLLDCQARSLRPTTLRYYRQQITWFLECAILNGAKSIEAITPHVIRAYLVSLQKRGWKSASVHAAARAVRAFLNFCVADDILKWSPMRKVKMPTVDREIKGAFTPEEVRRLLEACETQRDRAIVMALLDTGLRASELLALNNSDINALTGVIGDQVTTLAVWLILFGAIQSLVTWRILDLKRR